MRKKNLERKVCYLVWNKGFRKIKVLPWVRKYVLSLLKETCKIDCRTMELIENKTIELRVMKAILLGNSFS